MKSFNDRFESTLAIKNNLPKRGEFSPDISDIMSTPQMQENVKAVGYEPLPGTPDELQKYVDSEIVNFKKAVKKYNINIQ